MTLQRRTPLKPISPKRRAYRQTDEGKAGMAHMARVRALPCCICTEWELQQTSPTEAHHVIHGRYSARKAPDTQTIPLCADHHRESRDPEKIALHKSPSLWKRIHGEDVRWLTWVEHRLGLDQMGE